MNLLSKIIDDPVGVITVYGEAGSGKTNFCLVSAWEAAKAGKKCIYIDPQNNFSAERFVQISSRQNDLLGQIMIMRPKSFAEQETLLAMLRKGKYKDIGLVVIDPISAFYRLEFAKKDKDAYAIGRNLGIQMSYLNDIARNLKIPVIVTAQIHANPDSNQQASMVGGNILDYMSTYIIELKRREDARRSAILKKPKSGQREEKFFEIIENGIFLDEA